MNDAPVKADNVQSSAPSQNGQADQVRSEKHNKLVKQIHQDLIQALDFNPRAWRWNQMRFYQFMVQSLEWLSNDDTYAKYFASIEKSETITQVLHDLYHLITRRTFKSHRKELDRLFSKTNMSNPTSLFLRVVELVQNQSSRYAINKERFQLSFQLYRQLLGFTGLKDQEAVYSTQNAQQLFNDFMTVRAGSLKASMSCGTWCLNCCFPCCR